MDILDPLDSSGDGEVIESKVMLADIKTQHQIDSDDEHNVVEHLSPQTLLETPGEEMQYSVRSAEGGMITYRVLQVDDGSGESIPHMVSPTSSNFSNTGNVPQVITSNLNGQLYIVSGTNDLFGAQSGGGRAIAPRPNVTEGTTVVQHAKKRDERRRATHNEVERRRRDKINNWITKLGKIIPEGPQDPKGNGQYDGHSKGGILAKACEYIVELQQNQNKVEDLVKENRLLKQGIEILKQRSSILEKENKEYKELLKRNGIEVPSDAS